jgi:hypothetical protein
MIKHHPRAGRLRWLLGGAAAAGIVVAVALGWRATRLPLPPYSPSRFLNVGPDAQFIGSAACKECHERNYKSYLVTEHSRALSDLNVDEEPPDGAFKHPLTGRTYRVYRDGKSFRHEEVLRTEDGELIGRVDVPIRYLVGSGHFTRSYFAESDGFLHESPITWYTSKKKWAMSPGYDAPRHWGFERPAVLGCVACHAGRVEEVPGTLHKIVFHEQAIGCENCHGPGSLHQALHRDRKPVTAAEDLTIVNPGKLSRPLQEAICGSCHLNGPALVMLRGRQRTDFRPGRPLTDYRIDYRLSTGTEEMTVVGHIEQLRRSACYQASDMTCITCHDLHAKQKPTDVVAYYRAKCLDCHTSQGCGLGAEERLKRDATDNCVACHMPRGNTDIPHIAFTHHRIGRHTEDASLPPTEVPELVPTDDVSHVPAIDRQRNLGLAYLQAVREGRYPEYANVFRARGRSMLEGVYTAGLGDAETLAALAFANWGEDVGRSAAYAKEALEHSDATSETRAAALVMLAGAEMQDSKFASARGRLEELVQMRRFAEDWRLLGLCYRSLDGPKKAVPALEHALTIRPFRAAIHQALAGVYREDGDNQRAEEQAAKAKWLQEHRQD